MYVDTTVGIKAVYDKQQGRNFTVSHDLFQYSTTTNDAYGFSPKGTVDATKARDRINPVSLKVTKFSHTKVREIFKRYQVSLCLAFVATTVPALVFRCHGKVVENPAIKAQAVLDARLFAEAERMDKLQELEKVRRLCLCLCLPTFPSFLPHFRLYEVVSLHMCVLP